MYMERTNVVSSNIVSVGWDRGILEVEFKGGSVYQYSNVPKEVYYELLNSESVGKTLNITVKGRYEYEKLSN